MTNTTRPAPATTLREAFEPGNDRLRFAGDAGLFHDAARCVHDAEMRDFQRNVEPGTIGYGGLLDAWRSPTADAVQPSYREATNPAAGKRDRRRTITLSSVS